MFGFNPDKLSVKCQLCMKRLGLVRNRKHIQIRTLKQEVAEMMKNDQDINARIRVEEVIRQEWLLQAYATLETYLLLLQTRAGMLKKAKEPPPDMREAINTVLFSAERVKFELDEMPGIADILMSKFRGALCEMYNTKEFAKLINEEHTAIELNVNPTVVAGLSVTPASPQEKLAKLEQIAKEFSVPFDKEAMERELLPANPRFPQKVQSPYESAQAGAAAMGQAYVYVPQMGPAAPAAVAPAPAPPPPAAPAPTAPAPTVTKVGGYTIQYAPGMQPPQPPSAPPPAAAQAPRPSAPVRAPSNKSPDPWAPLPPQKLDQGVGFEDKLDSLANFYMGGRRQSGSQASGGGSGSQDLSNLADSASSKPSEGAAVASIAEEPGLPEVPVAVPAPAAEEEGLPSPPRAEAEESTNLPPAAPSASGPLDQDITPTEQEEDDKLAAMLARLKGL